MQRRVYKYPLRLTRSQMYEIESLLNKCREFYNAVRDLDIQQRNHTGLLIPDRDVVHQIKDVKNELDEYDTIHSHLLQSTSERYFRSRDITYANYKRRLSFDNFLEEIKDLDPNHYTNALRTYKKKYKDKENSPFPRFKTNERFNTIMLKQANNGYQFKENNKIRFNKMTLTFVPQRPYEGKVKFVGITRKLGKYFLLVYTETEHYNVSKSNNTLNNYKNIKVISTKQDSIVGIDIGIKEFLTCSDGTVYHNPKLINHYKDKMNASQTRLQRKCIGSKRYLKQKLIHAKHEAKLANVREDFLHKVSKDLVNSYDCIILEDLDLKELVHDNYKVVNKHLANVVPAKLVQFLLYKAENAGKRIITVDPHYTTRMCSSCGDVKAKKLSDRMHCCEACGLTLDRDLNASINILALGLNVLNKKLSSKELSGPERAIVTSTRSPCL